MKQLTNGYSLKLAGREDTAALVNMGLRFFSFSEYSKLRSPEIQKVMETVDWYLSQPKDTAVVILLQHEGATVGMLAGMKAPMPFWSGFVAAEQVWWVDEEHRGRHSITMLKAFEEWARLTDCFGIVMASLESNNKVSSIYTKMGFKLSENAYYKDLTKGN